MIVVNFFAGPGSGKSTTSADVFAHLKRLGVRTELVGEYAKEVIYKGASVRLANQALMAARQYDKLVNLSRSGCSVAVSDSPLLMQQVYSTNLDYHEELCALMAKLNAQFDNINIFIRRNKPYDTFGRMQKTIEEAKAVDRLIFDRFVTEFHAAFFTDEYDSIKKFVVDNLLEKGVLNG
jgi:hypothetical protein